MCRVPRRVRGRLGGEGRERTRPGKRREAAQARSRLSSFPSQARACSGSDRKTQVDATPAVRRTSSLARSHLDPFILLALLPTNDPHPLRHRLVRIVEHLGPDDVLGPSLADGTALVKERPARVAMRENKRAALRGLDGEGVEGRGLRRGEEERRTAVVERVVEIDLRVRQRGASMSGPGLASAKRERGGGARGTSTSTIAACPSVKSRTGTRPENEHVVSAALSHSRARALRRARQLKRERRGGDAPSWSQRHSPARRRRCAGDRSHRERNGRLRECRGER